MRIFICFIAILFTLNSTAASINTPEEIIKRIIKAADTAGVDSDLALAIVQIESDFNPKAVTYEPKYNTFSVGLFQMLLPTARIMGFRGTIKELQQPDINIPLGIRHLVGCTDRFNDSVPLKICCHNAGANVKPSVCKRNLGVKEYVDKVMIVYRSWRTKRSVGSSATNTIAWVQ